MFFSAKIEAWGDADERILEVDTVSNDLIVQLLKSLDTVSQALKQPFWGEKGDAEFFRPIDEAVGMRFLFATGDEILIVCDEIEIEFGKL